MPGALCCLSCRDVAYRPESAYIVEVIQRRELDKFAREFIHQQRPLAHHEECCIAVNDELTGTVDDKPVLCALVAVFGNHVVPPPAVVAACSSDDLASVFEADWWLHGFLPLEAVHDCQGVFSQHRPQNASGSVDADAVQRLQEAFELVRIGHRTVDFGNDLVGNLS